ncbi:tRNA dihydrouridine synthase DusB [Aureimonas populi]|nr:tRNA dihydrouridine synthase DusB [Aureimonas populi]
MKIVSVEAKAVPPSQLAVGPIRLSSSVFLAPLSGISDVPFRRLARRFGAGLVFSEMVASGELLKGSSDSLQRAMSDGAGLHAVQLAGRDARTMGEAAARLAGEGADLIDINFGCPAKKVVGGMSGSALMREPELALRIVEAAVAGARAVPVTVKMRLGWDRDSLNASEIARGAERVGARMVTVHGRTRDQFYGGQADWAAISGISRAVSIPVVANGDLVRADQEAPMRAASGCDAVMIGRGACGRPWFPGLVAGAVSRSDLEQVQLADIVVEHYESMLSHYGAQAGFRHARKHLGWYLDRLAAAFGPECASARAELLRESDPARVVAALRVIFGGVTPADVEFNPRAQWREAA